MPNRNVIPIKDAPPGDFRNLGVPASRLAALAQAGLAIPEGFVVSQEVLSSVLDAEVVAKLGELGMRAEKATEEERPGLCQEAGSALAEQLRQHADRYVMTSERVTHRASTGQAAADTTDAPRIELF